MAALCLDASLETLRPYCYHGTHFLQEDLCCCFHEGSLQTVQVVVMLSASHVLQNIPQFIVQGVDVWTPRGPILGADKCQNVPPQPLLSHLGLVGRRWVLLEDPFLTIEESYVKMFHNCVAYPLDTLGHQFSHLSRKSEEVSPPDGTPPTKPWRRKGDGLSAPLEPSPSTHRIFEHKPCCSGGCTTPRWWRFSRLWRGCFHARSWRATGGDALFLSVGSPSKQE